jgi:hypothetical protein
MSQLYDTDQRINPLTNKMVHRLKTPIGNCWRLGVLRSASFIEEHMPRSMLTGPFTEVTRLFSTLVHCPICNIPQPMQFKGSQPALYCGKDTIFYRCTKCGNETSKRVMARD